MINEKIVFTNQEEKRFQAKRKHLTFLVAIISLLTITIILGCTDQKDITKAYAFEQQSKKTVEMKEKVRMTSSMVFVRGGCYQMGCGNWAGDCGEDEKPVHKVCVDDYYLDKYEVSQKELQGVMGTNPFNTLWEKDERGPAYPALRIVWFEAKEYCEKNGKRLPTEAEWEFAARERGKPVKYGTGTNDINFSLASFAVYEEDEGSDDGLSMQFFHIGSLKPNSLGLYDMSGNVMEWCSDWYEKGYYRDSPMNNPQGPRTGKLRVVRGGSALDKKEDLRTSSRGGIDPYTRPIGYVGFRCAKTP